MAGRHEDQELTFCGLAKREVGTCGNRWLSKQQNAEVPASDAPQCSIYQDIQRFEQNLESSMWSYAKIVFGGLGIDPTGNRGMLFPCFIAVHTEVHRLPSGRGRVK